jgi:hypothetical protein
MANTIKHSEVAKELKKEYLKEHLESVKTLICSWRSELHPAEPLAPANHVWGWQSPYRSPREANPDDNHMLRHHLKSRALWSHHSMWERKLEEVWHFIEQARLKGKAMKDRQSMNSPFKYTCDYVPLALWKAFDMALGKAIELPFKVPDDQLGLCYGAYRIEESANTPKARAITQEDYKNFIRSLSQTAVMKHLADSWLEASQLEEQISTIADKMLKSGDVFYICGFCRHLWV